MRSPRNSSVDALPSFTEETELKTEVLTKAEASHSIPCLRCGECCRCYQVCLDLAEVRRMADELGLTSEDFRYRYADRRWPSERSILVRQENGCCPFLDLSGENGDELCGIHSFKPLSCRQWKPSLFRRECQAGLARRWGITVNSSGEPIGPDGRMRDFRLYLDSLASDGRI